MNILNEKNSRCLVRVYREGLAAAVGHDLVLECGAFEVTLDPEARSVSGRFQADSLRVLGTPDEFSANPRGFDSRALGERDRRKIEQNMQKDVLQTSRYPVITFESTSVSSGSASPPNTALQVDGKLTLHGATRPISVSLVREQEEAVARVRLEQPDFGITPFRALMGALKIKAHVDVELRCAWAFDAWRDP